MLHERPMAGWTGRCHGESGRERRRIDVHTHYLGGMIARVFEQAPPQRGGHTSDSGCGRCVSRTSRAETHEQE